MAINRFERGATTYRCACCKRLTRNTGDEGSTGLCFECFELAGIDNEISDNGPLGPDSFSRPEYVVELLGRLKAHGVDLSASWGDGHIAPYIDQLEAR